MINAQNFWKNFDTITISPLDLNKDEDGTQYACCNHYYKETFEDNNDNVSESAEIIVEDKKLIQCHIEENIVDLHKPMGEILISEIESDLPFIEDVFDNNYILNYSDNYTLELEIPDNIELEKEPKTEYVPITLRKKVFYLKYYKRRAIRIG